jgi:preprotein translocase subunit SecD
MMEGRGMSQKQLNVLLLALTAVLLVGSWLLLWPPRGEDVVEYRDFEGTLQQAELDAERFALPPEGSGVTATVDAALVSNADAPSGWAFEAADDAAQPLDYDEPVEFEGVTYIVRQGATSITQGLDIQGGLSVILRAEDTTVTAVTAAHMDRAELIIRNRVDGLGVREASIQRQGADALLVQIPGIRDAEQALEVLGSTGQLEFVDVATITDPEALAAVQAFEPNVQLPEGSYTAFMTGEVVRSAGVGQDPTTAEIEVTLSMDANGTRIWREYTTANIGRQVAIVLDGRVQSAPVVRSPIPDGQTSITGNFTVEEARNLKAVLETGALPVTLIFEESRVVGPTLGQDSLRQGIFAALVGLGLVALYVLVFYRGLGLLTVGGLVLFASIFLGVLAAMSGAGLFALTLPGIAGIVLTIGLAADSSILILERFKEEIRMGKTIRSAANTGSKHGMMTSIDADLVTLVSAAALYFVAIGPVRGFALTLMIGIFCDILVMFIYKRPALILLGEKVMPKAPAFWGIPKERVAATDVSQSKGGVAGA